MDINTLMIVFSGGLFSILVVILGWIGNRVHTRLDDLTIMLDEKLTNVTSTLSTIEKDLRSELTKLDRRTTILEVGRSGIRDDFSNVSSAKSGPLTGTNRRGG